MVEVFIQSLLMACSGAVMPGSLLAYTIDRSLKDGAKTGPLVSIGHAILEMFIVVFLLLGLAKYLDNPTVHMVIGMLGGAILLYLGADMVRSSFSIKLPTDLAKSTGERRGNLILGGVVISVSNPYFIIWWAAIGFGLVAAAYTSFGIPGVIAFYLGHILVDIGWYSFVSVMLSKTKSFINVKVYRAIILLLGLFLVVFGLRFLYFALLSAGIF